MKKLLVALIIGTMAVPASAQTIEVGRADWDKLPKLSSNERSLAYASLVSQVEGMLKEKKCTLAGQTPRRFDIRVPYAVQFQSSGQLSRVIVAEMQCEPLETLVGEVAIALANVGALKPAAGATRWYASEINFTLE